MSLHMLTLIYALFCGNLLIASARRKKDKCRVKYDLHECLTSGKPQNDYKCRHKRVCRKTFHLTYINLQPYNEALIKYLLENCCGECTNLTVSRIKRVNQLLRTCRISFFLFSAARQKSICTNIILSRTLKHLR